MCSRVGGGGGMVDGVGAIFGDYLGGWMAGMWGALAALRRLRDLDGMDGRDMGCVGCFAKASRSRWRVARIR